MEHVITQALPYINGLFVTKVDSAIESIFCTDEAFANGYKYVIDFEEFIDFTIDTLGQKSIVCQFVENEDSSFACVCNFGDKKFIAGSKIEALAKAAIFFLKPEEKDEYIVFIKSSFKLQPEDSFELRFQPVTIQEVALLRSLFPSDTFAVFKMLSPIEAVCRYIDNKEVIAFYDDGTDVVMDDFFDVSQCDVYGYEFDISSFNNYNSPFVHYKYCLNEGSCIHRRGCRRWVGNLPNKMAIEVSDVHYIYIADFECMSPVGKNKMPYGQLDRFRLSSC